ncbi:hypothetical protein [Paraclostridium dentum]|uniref:hypothetical protein n=1 Tax=Paraclostridium dentum TaxID=2662455 RepID=UPI001474D4E6|nr:hypothetical protein [Paraclostridium dentum]
MKNLAIPTKLTQGASKEQLLIEKEMNELLVKGKTRAVTMFILTFTIIGIPVVLLLAPKTYKIYKRLKQLQGELDDLIIKEASKN